MKKPSLPILFLAVFIDLIGFGIVLPLLPLYAKNLGAHGFTIGALGAAYSAMQFVFAPVWGRLSDKIGRRPMLLMGTTGAALSYCLFAIGSGMAGKEALYLLFASRLLGGIFGSNITIAQAYIADITPPQDRSRRMGLIGMAFGLGFIFGPIIGFTGLHFFGPRGPGWIAASICAVNLIWAFAMLPESWTRGGVHVTQRPRLQQWIATFSHPVLGLLIGIFFLATFCFTTFELTIGLLINQTFGLNIASDKGAGRVALLIAYCGIMGAFVQGGATGRLVKKLGEPKLIALCMFMAGIGMAMIPYSKTWGLLLVSLGIFAIGSSLTRPPVFGMISAQTSAEEQGAALGVAQSAGSLARVLGPVFAGSVFEHHPFTPYLTCAALCVVAALIAWQFLHKVHAANAQTVPGN